MRAHNFFYTISLEDISPPCGVKAAMEMQAEAERNKRAPVLESEGDLLFFFSSSMVHI